MLQNLSRFVGSSLGGLIIARYGTATAFHFNALSFAAVVVAWLAVRPAVPPVEVVNEPFMSRLVGGFRYARSHRAVRNLLLLIVVVSCFIVQQPLLPLVTKRLLHQGSGTYGVLNSVTGLGAMAGAFVAGRLALGRHRLAVTTATFAIAVAVVSIGLSHRAALSVAMEFVDGCGLFILLTICMTRIVLATAEAYLGRVMALQSMAIGGIVPLNGVVAGLIASRAGLTPTIVGAGIGLACFLVWYSASGALSALDETTEVSEVVLTVGPGVGDEPDLLPGPELMPT